MNYSTKFNPSTLHVLLPFCSTDETRYSINGILVQHHEGGTQLVATDGRRLIVHTPAWDRVPPFDQFIIPRTVLAALPEKTHPSDRWMLEADNGMIQFTGPDYIVRCRPIDVNYPDWKRVMPDPLPTDFPSNPWLNRNFINEAVGAMDALDENGMMAKKVAVKLTGTGELLVMSSAATIILINGMRL